MVVVNHSSARCSISARVMIEPPSTAASHQFSPRRRLAYAAYSAASTAGAYPVFPPSWVSAKRAKPLSPM